MLSCDATGGRFIVGTDRLSFSTGGALALAGAHVYDIPGIPAYFVEVEDLHVEELDLTVAEQKAVQGGFDTRRWFQGIMAKKAYLLSLRQGQCFIYIVDILDCRRSFLFLGPEASREKDVASEKSTG